MKIKQRKKVMTIILLIMTMLSLWSGCSENTENERENTITVYLWSAVLYDRYAPYIQSELPDVNIEFIVGQNDLEFYKFVKENGQLPDIIMSRRFSRHDAVPLKDQLMDLSSTEEAGAVYETYLRDFTNADGTINWLPVCGVGDGIVANKKLFEDNNIPLPTDYDSFVAACQAFEELGIRGFASDFIYDYTCMEILQGISIPEITSMEGNIWRSHYEDPEDAETGLDDKVWPVVFENMEKFIKDVKISEEDLEMDYGPLTEQFRNGKVAMIRAGSKNVVWFNEEGVEAVFLPYFGNDGEQWILTYPEFQVALNKDLEKNASRKEKAMQVLNVMLSEGAQAVLSNNEDVITYYKNMEMEMSPVLENIKPIISQNHLYIRIASNDFFATSKDVVHKMIKGEYDAKQAYEAFDTQLRQKKSKESEIILTQEKGYSNIFNSKGGNESYSVMANTIRCMYDGDVLIAPGFGFTGSVFAADYTENQVKSMIMPNNLLAYTGEMTGAELKECIRDYVEGAEEGFKPFNRGSLPVVSGIAMEVQEKNGKYTLLEVNSNGKTINENDKFKVICLNTNTYIEPFMKDGRPKLVMEEELVKDDLVNYIKNGGLLKEPEKYINLKKDTH